MSEETIPPGWGLRPMPVGDAAAQIAMESLSAREARGDFRMSTNTKPTPPEIVERIHELAREGVSNDEIARRLGMHYRTTWRYAREVRS